LNVNPDLPCYLAAIVVIVAIAPGRRVEALWTILAIVLVRTPAFWAWAATVREVTFRGVAIRRR
jgi:hypothetical protein